MEKWRYFGRFSATGGGIYEIFRIPDNGKEIWYQDLKLFPEFLRPDGSWAHAPLDEIAMEAASGYFNEVDDEITEEEVAASFARWKEGKWPGRRFGG